MTTPARWSKMADRRGLEPRSAGSEPAVLPLDDLSVVGSGGFEPPRFCDRGRRATDYPTTRDDGRLAGIRTLSASEEKWNDSRGAESLRNPDLHGLSVPRLPIAPRADVPGSAYGYRTPSASEAKRDESREAESSRNPFLHAGDVKCTSTPRPSTDRCRSPARRRTSVFKEPALSSWWPATDSNLRLASRTPRRTHPSRHLGRVSRDSRPKQKRPSRGSP
jgi:hypothetical protein